jgi:hypothetical protein
MSQHGWSVASIQGEKRQKALQKRKSPLYLHQKKQKYKQQKNKDYENNGIKPDGSKPERE